jgi:hypothetical protein
MFISFLYMFWATMCPLLGENNVPMRLLVLVTLNRVTNTRYCIGTVFSPDDGHIVARNMSRKTMNILRKFVHEVGSIYNNFVVSTPSVVLLSVGFMSCLSSLLH